MEEALKTIYRLILTKNARVARITEYKSHFDVLLEWNVEMPPEFDQNTEYVETKLVALIKPRR